MNVKENFSGRAADYTTGRPGYAKELIDYMYNEYGMTDTSVIADIGSGTGKFARHLLQNDKEYDHYKTSLDDIFNKYSDQGMVTIGNHSVAYIGSM